MFIKQVSVFLENKQGRLAEVTGILAKDKINIKALSMAESRDFGILRLIVNDWNKCVEVLKKHSFITRTTDVVGVEIDDNPGGLCLVMDTIEQQGVNIEYMYAAVKRSADKAVVLFRVDDNDKTIKALKEQKISIVPTDFFAD
ncbi:MAG: amino acid-binding protein [Spirochaetales bacterium]|nr:amino acid-binding protein [Spirochaetales bacterium]